MFYLELLAEWPNERLLIKVLGLMLFSNNYLTSKVSPEKFQNHT